MSDLIHEANVGQAVGAAAGTTLVATLTVAVPAHGVIVVRASTYGGAADAGPTNRHTGVTDPAGHTYTKLAEVSNSDGNVGATVSLWIAEAEVGLAIGQTVTLQLGSSLAGRVLLVDSYDKGGASQALSLVGAAAALGESTSPAVSLTPAASAPYTWIGAGAHAEGQLTVTPSGSWLTDRPRVAANGGTHGNNTSLWGQYLVFAGASVAWASTLSSSRRWGMVLAAVAVVERIREMPSEAVADVFYGRPILLDEPNWISAVGRTVATELVPVGGVVGPWDARLASQGTTARVALDALFTAFGRDQIAAWRTFLDALGGRHTAFWCPTWTAEAHLTADALDAQPDLQVGPGHVLVADDWVAIRRRNTSLVCGQVASVDGGGSVLTLGAALPVTIPQPLSRVSRLLLVRLDVDEVGLTFLAHDIAEIRLRMVSVPPVELAAFDVDVPVGDPSWQESERPPVLLPPVLARPHFSMGEVNDVTWYRGELYRSGTGAPVSYPLRVVVDDACDAVELQCSDLFPVGFQPDKYVPGGPPFIWTEQPQEVVGPYAPGATPTFNVLVSHGNGVMSPAAFRIRTRKDFGGQICYSPWRYWLAIPEPEPVAATSDTGSCGREQIICANMPGDWYLGPRPPGTTGPPCTDPGPSTPPGGTNCVFLTGAWTEPFTLPLQFYFSYAFFGRNKVLLNFSDRHLQHNGTARSRVSSSTSGTSPFQPNTGFVNTDQSPLEIP